MIEIARIAWLPLLTAPAAGVGGLGLRFATVTTDFGEVFTAVFSMRENLNEVQNAIDLVERIQKAREPSERPAGVPDAVVPT